RPRFRRRDGHPATRFTLCTSWRNGTRILDAANTIVGASTGEGAEVPTLEARPGASGFAVDSVYPETVTEEAAAVAAWLRERLDEARRRTGKPASAALLLRARKTQPHFLDAMR